MDEIALRSKGVITSVRGSGTENEASCWIGTGVLINAFRASHLDAAGLEPALVEMERFNDVASRLALEHGAHAATDVTGFGLGGHALGLARSSGVGLLLRWAGVPRHDAFRRLHALGVSTGCTAPNREHVGAALVDRAGLDEADRALLFELEKDGVQRAVIDGELVVARLLDPARDAVAVLRAHGVQRLIAACRRRCDPPR